MVSIIYSPAFLHALKKLPPELIVEVEEKITLFQDEKKHEGLHVHKLRGKLKGQQSFRVNYKIRIVFYYIPEKDNTALLTAIGDHDIYN